MERKPNEASTITTIDKVKRVLAPPLGLLPISWLPPMGTLRTANEMTPKAVVNAVN